MMLSPLRPGNMLCHRVCGMPGIAGAGSTVHPGRRCPHRESPTNESETLGQRIKRVEDILKKLTAEREREKLAEKEVEERLDKGKLSLEEIEKKLDRGSTC